MYQSTSMILYISLRALHFSSSNSTTDIIVGQMLIWIIHWIINKFIPRDILSSAKNDREQANTALFKLFGKEHIIHMYTYAL